MIAQKSDFKLKTIEEVLQFAKDAAEDSRYERKKTKVPNKQRQAQARLDFWASVQHHLKQVK